CYGLSKDEDATVDYILVMQYAQHGVYGVIPYMAHEIIRREPYTPESDVYSFVIMSELSSGELAFILALEICDGSKPIVPEASTSHFYKSKAITFNSDSKNLTEELIVEDATNHKSKTNCPENNIDNTNRSINIQEIINALDSANSLNLNLLV
ncbi:29725_t:CDS:2, partial [Gigaspora margarita]